MCSLPSPMQSAGDTGPCRIFRFLRVGELAPVPRGDMGRGSKEEEVFRRCQGSWRWHFCAAGRCMGQLHREEPGKHQASLRAVWR